MGIGADLPHYQRLSAIYNCFDEITRKDRLRARDHCWCALIGENVGESFASEPTGRGRTGRGSGLSPARTASSCLQGPPHRQPRVQTGAEGRPQNISLVDFCQSYRTDVRTAYVGRSVQHEVSRRFQPYVSSQVDAPPAECVSRLADSQSSCLEHNLPSEPGSTEAGGAP